MNFIPIALVVGAILGSAVVLILFDIARALERNSGLLEPVIRRLEECDFSLDQINIRLTLIAGRLEEGNSLWRDWHTALGRSGKGPL